MKREDLQMAEDVRMGWEKNENTKVWTFSKEENEELEMRVLKDLGYVD
jgi:hypothetical protein